MGRFSSLSAQSINDRGGTASIRSAKTSAYVRPPVLYRRSRRATELGTVIVVAGSLGTSDNCFNCSLRFFLPHRLGPILA